MMYIETSAKEKIGVNEAFEEVVNKVLESPMIEDIALKKQGAAGQNGRQRLNYTVNSSGQEEEGGA